MAVTSKLIGENSERGARNLVGDALRSRWAQTRGVARASSACAILVALVLLVAFPVGRSRAATAHAAAWPVTTFTVQLPGVPGALGVPGVPGGPTPSLITVTYDAVGTPHIVAPSEASGSAGLCWAMAHDRLFQLDLLRRSAAGRLAEIFGAGPSDAVLQQDELMRTEGLTTLANAHFLAASPRAKADLTACTAGINAVIRADEAMQTLPLEFADLHYQPDRWQPQDSMLIATFLSSSLDSSVWAEKIARAATMAIAGPPVAAALIPSIPATPSLFDRSGRLNPLRRPPISDGAVVKTVVRF